MSLERVVRPFQRDDVFTARVLAPVQPAVPPNADNAEISWQGEADNKVAPAPDIVRFEVKINWDEDKSRRKTETVRITNPDDKRQYIDVERIKQMVLKNSATGEEIALKPDFSKAPHGHHQDDWPARPNLVRLDTFQRITENPLAEGSRRARERRLSRNIPAGGSTIRFRR